MKPIDSSVASNLQKIHWLSAMVHHSQGFIFFENRLVVNSIGNIRNISVGVEDYLTYEDTMVICQQHNIKTQVVMDQHPLKIVNIFFDETVVNAINSHDQWTIILDNNFHIKKVHNGHPVLMDPQRQGSFQQWWDELVDKGIVLSNSYEDLIKAIQSQSNYLLTTLNDQCFNISCHYNRQYIIKIEEITKTIGAQRNLKNNCQLIEYLIETVQDPMMVFNHNQEIQFTNNQAQEFLSVINYTGHCLSQLSHHLQSYKKGTNQMEINNKPYVLKIKIIGNFIVWIFQKSHEVNLGESMAMAPSKDEQIWSIESKVNDDRLLLENLDMANPLEESSVKNLSRSLCHNMEKFQYYYQKNTQITYEFNHWMETINEKWGRYNKIFIKNKINKIITINTNKIFGEHFFHWLIGDIINWSSLYIEFKTVGHRGYVILKLLELSSRWVSQELLEYLKNSYGSMIQENGGYFKYIVDKYPIIYVGFKGTVVDKVTHNTFFDGPFHGQDHNHSSKQNF
jgi:hypothetical protein